MGQVFRMRGVAGVRAVAAWGAVAALLGACSLAVDERDEMAEQIYGRTWIASQIDGQPVVPGIVSDLLIAADGKVSGNAGCNSYFGSAIVDNDAMAFGNLGTTKKACPGPAMGQEDRMLQALDSTRGYRLDQEDLLLLDAGGNTVLRLTLGQSA